MNSDNEIERDTSYHEGEKEWNKRLPISQDKVVVLLIKQLSVISDPTVGHNH